MANQAVPPAWDIPDISLDPPSETSTWTRGDIAFLAIGSPIYVCIIVEWIAWLLAFYYCLYHCGIKAFRSKDYIKVLLTILVTIVFTAVRLFFIPVLVVSLPMPSIVRERIPDSWSIYLQNIAFYAFVVLLFIPSAVIIFNLFTKPIGRIGRYANQLTDNSPKVCIVMPCYNEAAENVMKCINSIAAQDYPMACLHICLSFDSDQIGPEYLDILGKLGVPSVRRSKYPISLDVRYRGMRVTVSRYKHGGKRHTQKKTFQMIDKLYGKYLERQDDVYLLFIDSDCNLDRYAVQNFMYEMDFLPREKGHRALMAMTGVITSRADKNSFVTLLQDIEYLHGQLFERAVESRAGACTCLPGALTCLKFSAFRNMANFYFADVADKHDNPFDYGQYHLGEDRWLTHLFMIGAKYSHQIGFTTSAFCKTDACHTWRDLTNQRTRWFKGFITNEAAMLTDWILWKRYPWVCLYRLVQDTIRTTALLMALMILSLMTTVQVVKNLPWPLIILSLGANWIFMLWYGVILNRKKAWLYPILFMANPIINWWYLVASVYSYRRRTWGGPRVKKDGQLISPEDEDTESDGLPELSERERDAIREAALPWRTLSGRFVPASQDEDGLYHRSELHLPMSGRSSVVLPQLLDSDAASTVTRSTDLGSALLSPPVPGRRNRNSTFSEYSYDSEVGRLYAPAQSFLRTDQDQMANEERHLRTPTSIEDYGVRLPVPMDDLTTWSATSSSHHGDLGAMNLLQIQQGQFEDEFTHAISDDMDPRLRHSVQHSIDMIYPKDGVNTVGHNRPGSADSWSRDDEVAFTSNSGQTTNTDASNPFDTPKSDNVDDKGSSSSSRKTKRLSKKKPTHNLEIDDSKATIKKGFFSVFKGS